MAAHVNDALAESRLTPALRRHDGLDWHLHAVADEQPFAERILIETAMALIDVIRADEGSRLSVCDDDTCESIALDLSRKPLEALLLHDVREPQRRRRVPREAHRRVTRRGRRPERQVATPFPTELIVRESTRPALSRTATAAQAAG